MCGFIAALGNVSAELSDRRLRASLDRLARRGPDDEGISRESGAVFGHRRLAVLDLDPRARQPMESQCGRYTLVFNGEIYNFRELRAELQEAGYIFCTESDTEVLLALLVREGDQCLHRLRGMFTFVFWDGLKKRALIGRDPYGIKPLYISESSDGILLGSQVKALMATGLVSAEASGPGTAGFWMLGSVPEPYSWYRDIRPLGAGSAAWLENGTIGREWRWYDISDAWRQEREVDAGAEEIGQEVRFALRESIDRHLVSDVPVAVFLSGGIDSGALAGLMAEQGSRELVGVTITYDEFSNQPQDEVPGAAALAARYGLRHVVRRVSAREFEADLPRILDAMDQPSIDGVNTWYAAKAVAEQGIKVVVSGVGGDELFQGYRHFRSLPRLYRMRRILAGMPGGPGLLAALGRFQARRTGKQRWRHLAEWTNSIEGLWWLERSVLGPEEAAGQLDQDLREVLRDFDVRDWIGRFSGPLAADPKLALGQIESTTYLRNQLLRDSDWASMDHSVELRTPLVDATLLAGLSRWLPEFRRWPGKQLLGAAPRPALPQVVTRRRKTGFGIPVQSWLGRIESGCTPSNWQAVVAARAAEASDRT